jgi:hypothetical protein
MALTACDLLAVLRIWHIVGNTSRFIKVRLGYSYSHLRRIDDLGDWYPDGWRMVVRVSCEWLSSLILCRWVHWVRIDGIVDVPKGLIFRRVAIDYSSK